MKFKKYQMDNIKNQNNSKIGFGKSIFITDEMKRGLMTFII